MGLCEWYVYICINGYIKNMLIKREKGVLHALAKCLVVACNLISFWCIMEYSHPKQKLEAIKQEKK